MFEDIVNKTAEEAGCLQRSEKFLRDHLGVGELNPDCLRVLLNFAYLHVKYLNKKSTPTGEKEEKISVSAKKGPWLMTMQRVQLDKNSGRDHSVIKKRFSDLLKTIDGFEPL